MEFNDPTFLPIGTELSMQYKIVRHIGRGGFGKTYLVVDNLDKEFVLKELYISNMCQRDTNSFNVTVSQENQATYEQLRENFNKEAKKISKLNHPNIVKVLGLFKTNNTVYYVMDYVKGESLAKKLERVGRLDENTAVRYIDQLLDALEYIHTKKPVGIMHLDIKPANIMIDENDNVVLIDFGASKSFNSTSVTETLMSTIGLLCTPGYAPIEQENGDIEYVGSHCDIYAVGATLYKALSGNTPPRPFVISKKGLPEIPGVSQRLWQVIKKAMAYDYEGRIKTVAEFRAMLKDEELTIDATAGNAPKADSPNVGNTPINKRAYVGDTIQYEPEKPQKEKPIGVKRDKEPIKPRKVEKKVGQKEPIFAQISKYISKIPRNAAIVVSVALLAIIGVVALQNGKEEDSPMSEISQQNENPKEESTRIDKDVKTYKVGDVSFNMVYVQGGTFQMGSNDSEAFSWEKPIHSVTLSDYYIGETEVTQELWEAVMGNNPSFFKGSNKPVERVSWDDCQEFIKKLNQMTGKNFRLPTEAQWEYAARGGNKSRGYKYAGSNTIGEVVWYNDNAYYVSKSSPDFGTHRVGTKSPNELGLYDMTGNVFEWCSDWYGDYSSSSQTNPTGPTTGSRRVLRGGCWHCRAQLCRVAYRSNDFPDGRGYDCGFRLACGL